MSTVVTEYEKNIVNVTNEPQQKLVIDSGDGSRTVVVPQPQSPATIIIQAPSPSERVVVRAEGIQGAAGSGGVEYFESTSKNLKSYPATISYSDGKVSAVEYDLGAGQAITKTLSYSGGFLTTVTLSGDTPSGIDLIKNLVYTDGALVGFSYS